MSVNTDITISEYDRLANLETAVFGGPNPGDAGPKIAPVFYTGAADHIAYPGIAVLSRAGVDAALLAAPVSGIDDGKQLLIVSMSAYVHTVTTPANTIVAGTGSTYDRITFSAHVGANILLEAQQGIWVVVKQTGITSLTEV